MGTFTRRRAGRAAVVEASIGHFPLPTKLRARMLAPMLPREGECADDYGDRVEAAMQDALDELTRGRKPVIG